MSPEGRCEEGTMAEEGEEAGGGRVVRLSRSKKNPGRGAGAVDEPFAVTNSRGRGGCQLIAGRTATTPGDDSGDEADAGQDDRGRGGDGFRDRRAVKLVRREDLIRLCRGKPKSARRRNVLPPVP